MLESMGSENTAKCDCNRGVGEQILRIAFRFPGSTSRKQINRRR